MDDLDRAAELAHWLMTTKRVEKRVAVIIGCNKYKILFSNRKLVSKKLTHLRNHKGQVEMFIQRFRDKHGFENKKQLGEWLTR